MNQRYHALDNLRGIIMWLGVVIHVAVNHMVGESNIPWRDSQTGAIADIVVLFIHTFRMPVFFILAGFFTAMLLNKAGPRQMLIHRLKRLALPFAIFWPTLLIATMPLMLMFISKMDAGAANVDTSTLNASTFTTMHLWFLYYLIWFCVFSVVLHHAAGNLPSTWREKVNGLFSLLATNWWGIIILTLPLTAVGSFYQYGFLTPDTTLIPNIMNIIHNGLYFFFGWLCFSHASKLFTHYQRFCWHYTAMGFIIFMVVMFEFGMVMQGKLNNLQGSIIIATTYNIIGWIWSFALIGVFLRYANNHNPVLRYLADSSYWVYLVHMLGTVGFGLVLYDTSLTLIPKMLVNILLTSIACLVTYHFLVRSTWIGQFLNGRKLAPAKPTETTLDNTESPA